LVGKTVEGLKHLRAALDAGEATFPPSEKASIWLGIALAEEKENKEAAITAAEKVKEFAKEDSGAYLQALTIVADLTLTGAGRLDGLRKLEKQARSEEHVGLANTIALTLGNETKDVNEEIGLMNRILESKSSGYNHTRAIIVKADALRRAGRLQELKLFICLFRVLRSRHGLRWIKANLLIRFSRQLKSHLPWLIRCFRQLANSCGLLVSVFCLLRSFS